MEKKINLEEILKQLPQYSIGTEAVFYHKQNVIAAMKEVCRQTLELAAENAKIYNPGWCIGREYEKVESAHVIKQSILDTIKQIQ